MYCGCFWELLESSRWTFRISKDYNVESADVGTVRKDEENKHNIIQINSTFKSGSTALL